jgi:hypothetical protein
MMRPKSLSTAGWLVLVTCIACRSPEPVAPQPAPRVITGVAAPVEGQLQAYNRHDIDGFLSYYAPGVELYEMGRDSTSVTRGKDSMREGYQFLNQAPTGFRAEILKRMVAGRYVIDHERVIIPGQRNHEVLAIYEVSDSAITRVYFLPDP